MRSIHIRTRVGLYRDKRFANINFKEGKYTQGMFRSAITRTLLSAAFVLTLAFSTILPAQAATGGNGLRISPVRSDLIVSPGQSKSLYVSISNVTSEPATLQAVINDFVGNADESGNPSILLDSNQFAPKHSLKRFVSPIPNITLSPGQQKSVQVTLNVPKDAPGGGYFGAIRFSPASTASSKNQTVSLAGSVGSLILLKVPGDIKEQVSLSSFDIRQNDNPSSFFTNSKDLTVTVRFQNLGNIQEAPFGKILVKNRSGKVLSMVELNNTSPPGNVLPDSIRKFPLPIKNIGSLGQYKVEGNFGYGNSGQLLSASTTFYVIPTMFIIIFVLVVALFAFLVFGMPKLVRAYNKSVIRKAGRS